MAKNNGGSGAPKSKTSEEYDAIRRATKRGNNRAKSRPASDNPAASNPAHLVRTFDAQTQIVGMARAKAAQLRPASHREIALMVIDLYATERKRGDNPGQWHITRFNAATTVVKFHMELEYGKSWVEANSQLINGGFEAARSVLGAAQSAMEVARTRELKDLKFRKFDSAEVIARFTPPPVATTDEAENAETADEAELVATA